MSSGECQTKNRNEYDKGDDDAPIKALDEDDIALLKTYGIGPYANAIKNVEEGNLLIHSITGSLVYLP